MWMLRNGAAVTPWRNAGPAATNSARITVTVSSWPCVPPENRSGWPVTSLRRVATDHPGAASTNTGAMRELAR